MSSLDTKYPYVSALISFSSGIRNEDETNSPRRVLNELKTNWLRLVACYSNRKRNELIFYALCLMLSVLTQFDKPAPLIGL